MSYFMQHVLFALFSFGVGLFFFFTAQSMPDSARLFPQLVAALIFLLSFVMAFNARRLRKKERIRMFDSMILGLGNILQWNNMLAMCGGTALGLFVGAMPGLSATMAIALLVPMTFAMPPETGITMLASLYMGSMYGGSIAAILIRTPGTPSAAATVMDGYPMASRGEAGHALGISLFASFVGGVVSSIVLLTVAPLLGRVAVMFGPVELTSVAVLGMTIIASLS